MNKVLIVGGMYQKLRWDNWGTGVEAFNVELWRMLNRNKNTKCIMLAPSDTELKGTPYPLLLWNQPSKEDKLSAKPSSSERERKIEVIEYENVDYITYLQ